MNTKFDVGQRVTYPVVHTADGNVTGIAVSKAGVTRYAIGPKWYAEEDLNLAVGEKPDFGNPVTEPVKDSEPAKPYCVKSFMDVLSAGKIYEPDESGHIAYNDGRKLNHSVSDWEFDFIRIGNLVPLVRRPAKVGEWVIVTSVSHLTCNGRKPGNIFLVDGDKERADSNGFIWGSGIAPQDGEAAHQCGSYLVLDGYKGDAE